MSVDDSVLLRRPGITVTRFRALQVGGILVLLVVGAVLPYVSFEHYDGKIELVRSAERLFGAGRSLGGFDVSYLPSYDPADGDRINRAFNLIALGPSLQEIATVVAAATCWGLFFDEINKFFWWPLHLSGYLLVIVPVPLLIGLQLVRANRVSIDVGPAWVPGVVAGILILAVTFRARGRIDSYRGI